MIICYKVFVVSSEISFVRLLCFSRFWISPSTMQLFWLKLDPGMSIRMLRSLLFGWELVRWNSWLRATWEFISCFAVAVRLIFWISGTELFFEERILEVEFFFCLKIRFGFIDGWSFREIVPKEVSCDVLRMDRCCGHFGFRVRAWCG